MPFTIEQFLDVFRRYNEAVWPAQVALHALALAAVALALRPRGWSGRVASAVLAALWLWTGAAYHLAFFRDVNPAATAFGALAVAQGALFAWLGVVRGRLDVRARADLTGLGGAVLIAYALLVYPALGYALGHRYPAAPTFGLPCPTTIFTFGLLAWGVPPVPRVLLVVPVLWAVVGTVGAVELAMPEDLGLPVAAIIGALAVVARGRPPRRPSRTAPARAGAA